MATTNVDARNVKRGKCCLCQDCEEYEYVPGEIKSNCVYCNHPATDHESLGKLSMESNVNTPVSSNSTSRKEIPSTQIPSPTVSSGSLSETFTFSPSESLPVITLNPEVSIDEFLAATSSTIPVLNDDDIPLPEKLPKTLEVIFDFKKKTANPNNVNALIREVASTMYSKGLRPTPEVLAKVSRKAALKWSPLKVKGDSQCVGLANKIRRRYDKIKRDNSKSPSKRVQSEPMVDVALKMQDDWEQGKRNPAVMETYMDAVRTLRLAAVRKQAAFEHIRLYPALRITSVLLHEFEAIAGVKQFDMKSNVSRYIPLIIQQFKADHLLEDLPENCDENTKLISILKEYHLYKAWKKPDSAENRKCFILEMFAANTNLGQTWSANKDPPRLMGLENPEGGPISIHCFVDTVPLFVVNDVIDALCLLIGTFYAFHISWTPRAKLPLISLACLLMGPEKANISAAANNGRFIKFLKDIGIEI